MITITQGTTNQVILTLSEKLTLSNPAYLFEFVHDQTRQVYHFIAVDHSNFTGRYNEFHITEQTSPNLLSSQVSLPSLGGYHYTVYEQSSSTNLDPSLATGVLETGKLEVLSTDSKSITTYDAEPKTNIVYG